MEALSSPNLHTETFCVIFSLHKEDHTLRNYYHAFPRLRRHFENVQISAGYEPLTDMETSSGVPDVFVEASSYFDIHLRMRKMNVFIFSRVSPGMSSWIPPVYCASAIIKHRGRCDGCFANVDRDDKWVCTQWGAYIKSPGALHHTGAHLQTGSASVYCGSCELEGAVFEIWAFLKSYLISSKPLTWKYPGFSAT